jgi:hypothetical protein
VFENFIYEWNPVIMASHLEYVTREPEVINIRRHLLGMQDVADEILFPIVDGEVEQFASSAYRST